MGFYGQAEAAAQAILHAFEDTNSLPRPLARIFINRNGDQHCRKWSWGNRLLVILKGYSDARGFRQWEQAGRRVKKGEKAFHILAPVTRTVVDAAGEERAVVVGFKGVPVFGLEQTDGPPPAADTETEKWVESLPLVGVARRWGLSVDTFGGEGAAYLGHYRRGRGIALGVRNLATWAHELVHAADDRNGSLKEMGQHWRSETVAELGGAVLLEILGLGGDADLGGCREYVRHYADREGITVTDACMRVLDRTCRAVSLILEAAENIHREASEQGESRATAASSTWRVG